VERLLLQSLLHGSWLSTTAFRMVPATVAAIADAVHWAEEIMKEIDRKWPTERFRNTDLTSIDRSKECR